MNLEQIRKKYPQYNNLGDEKLIEGFRSKFYPQMSFGELSKKIGYISPKDGFIDRTTGLTNAPLRLKLGFVDNPKGREALVSQLYETRFSEDGKLLYKNPETTKWTTIDEQGISLRDMADLVGYTPEAVLATAGSVAGIFGVGIGSGAGTALKAEIGEKLSGVPEYENAADYAKALSVSGAAGVVGEGAGKALLKVANPMSKSMSREVASAVKYATAHGGKLTPAQQTQSRLLYTLENVAESSFFGGGRMAKFKHTQDKWVKSVTDEIAEKLGGKLGVEEAGLLIQKTLTDKKDAFNKVAKGMYSKVDRATEGAMVSTARLKQTAQSILKKSHNVKSLKNESTQRILKDFMKMDDMVPFSHMQEMRSDLLSIGYASTDLVPGKTQGVAKHLAKQIDFTFDNATMLSPKARSALADANFFWKKGKTTFNNKFIKSLSQKDPDKISDVIFQRNSGSKVKKVRRIIGEETFRELRGNYVTKLLTQKGVTNRGIRGEKIRSELRNIGQETLGTMFSPKETTELYNLVKAIELVQTKPTGLGGGIMVQLAQAGAILDLATAPFTSSPFTPVSAAVLITPAGLTQIFTREGGIKWLTKGLVTKPGTKAATKLSTRLMALAGKENIKILNEGGSNK